VISASLCADNVLKGKSLFAKLLGEQVASDAVTIIDRNDHPDGVRPAPFDGEGVSAQETGVLRGGRLETFLHNTYTAAKTGGGAVSTANARRGLGSSPAVGPSNLYLEPSARSFETLLQEAGEGLYVTNAMGVHTADAISGDFSFGASGLLIDKGELGRPVRGVTSAGNIKDLLLNVVAPASDLRFFGAHGAPSALVSSLMVSGE
jgi:PmbA protein